MTNIKEIFEADQSDRINPDDWDDPQKVKEIESRDRQRLAAVKLALENGEINTSEELYQAAMVFQHGEGPEDFHRANSLARQSMDMGFEKAKWLYAASLDRWLLSQGQRQKFCTQYYFKDGKKTYWPYDPATTREERQQYNVPEPDID